MKKERGMNLNKGKGNRIKEMEMKAMFHNKILI